MANETTTTEKAPKGRPAEYEKPRRSSIYIPHDVYDWLCQQEGSFSQAVTRLVREQMANEEYNSIP